MATLGSKLRTKEMKWHANMTEQNHLGMNLSIKPARFSKVVNKLFSSQNYYSDNPLTSMLFGNKKSEVMIEGTSWEWELKGANSRPLVVIENVMIGNSTPGKFKSNFQIKLDEDWFLQGDVICPGTSNKKYQSRVIEKKKHGNGYIYTLRIMSDNPQDFLPVKFLQPGTQWAKLYAMYGEGTRGGGSTTFSFPIAFSNSLSRFRKMYQVTDYADTTVLAVGIPDTKGKIQKQWMRYAEVEYWQQWYRELERGVWYTRKAETVLDENGRPVRSGAGIQEQLEDSHIHYYNHLTVKMIEEYLMDIFYSRTKPGQGRQIKGYTGEYGMLQFHRAIQDWAQQKGFIQNIEEFTNKTSSVLNKNSKEAGYQYVKYHFANGSTLELVHNPLYDDREINFEIDEVTGYPKESQRITFLDFSGNGNDSNIKLVTKKDSESLTYVVGSHGPTGPTKGGYSAHSGAYYEMHTDKTCGVHIEDVTKCGELILARN